MSCVRARLQSCHHSIHKNLEINQRDEVALKSRSTTKPGCPILAALLFLPQGWENTNVERGGLCVRERGGLCVRERGGLCVRERGGLCVRERGGLCVRERGGLCVRARLQSCRKCRRINAGFSPCGKFDPEGGGSFNPRKKPSTHFENQPTRRSRVQVLVTGRTLPKCWYSQDLSKPASLTDSRSAVRNWEPVADRLDVRIGLLEKVETSTLVGQTYQIVA
jgi:hypothetical protein